MDPECRIRLWQDSEFFSESEICEKPDPESLFIFGRRRSLRGLYKCHFLITNIAKFRFRGWFAEFEQE